MLIFIIKLTPPLLKLFQCITIPFIKIVYNHMSVQFHGNQIANGCKYIQPHPKSKKGYIYNTDVKITCHLKSNYTVFMTNKYICLQRTHTRLHVVDFFSFITHVLLILFYVFQKSGKG